MFCPSCGYEERETNQFCRACGSNISIVRAAIETPDDITQSAVLARSEVGSAIANKIREAQASELSVIAEEVLPQLEKFLESPEEKRLRRIRAGTIVSSIGIGVGLMFLIMLSNGAQSLIMVGLGIVTFFIGLGLIINGMVFSVSKKILLEKTNEAQGQRELDSFTENSTTHELKLAESLAPEYSSVVEHTTRQLSSQKK